MFKKITLTILCLALLTATVIVPLDGKGPTDIVLEHNILFI